MSVRDLVGVAGGISDDIAKQGIGHLREQAKLVKDQSDLATATSEFAKASLVNQTAHGISAKLIGLAKTVVQGYLGVA
jgi:hypothetical protein